MKPERWHQIDKLLEEALERDASDRAGFLDQACAGDESLRGKVEALLAASEQAGDFLTRPALEVAAREMAADERTSLLGQIIGHYRIKSLIGAGGMSEVYLAQDSTLGRKVAFKLLPPQFTQDQDRLRRFEREARAASSLNHPNIVTIYEIGRKDDLHYIVTEFIEGQTLRQRMAHAPMKLRESLDVAIQVASALAAAHAAGIVHRDIKPENVMLRRDGLIKVLDFGLAKLIEPKAPPSITDASTVAAVSTQPGVVMGTPRYMSPEQARGLEVDARSDIFSLGVALYEMIAGKAPFTGATSSDVIAAILHTEPPPLASSQPAIPPALDRLVKSCLAKEPDERWQSARDLARELKWMAEGGSQTAATALPAARSKKRAWVWLAAATLVSAIAIGLAAWLLSRAPAPASQPPTRFVVSLPPDARMTFLEHPVVAISPDGTRLVYAASNGRRIQLYLRAMDQIEAAPIPGTEGAYSPFFSPDGQWVGFFANFKMKKVSLRGGAPIDICSVTPVTRGASWATDDTIYFSPNMSGGLRRVFASGGEPQVITTPDARKGESGHLWPEVLPGGKAILFTIGTGGNFDEALIAALIPETGEQRILVRGGASAHYAATGHLVYARAGSIMAVTFDPSQLKVTGAPVQVLDGVMIAPWSGAAHLAFSRAGSLVYVPGSAQPWSTSLLWVDRRGTAQPLTNDQRWFLNPSLSPDGQRLAIATVDATQDVWVYEFARGTMIRLTFGDSQNFGPVWTPDGKRVTYTSFKSGGMPNLVWKPADGSGPEEQLTTGNITCFIGSWSPDGKTLAFTRQEVRDQKAGADIWLLSIAGERQSRPFIQTKFDEFAPAFSPDGRPLAYVSDESGRKEVYVQSFPGPGVKRRVSTEGGVGPVWARNGRELFYRHGDKVMAVTVTLQPEFTASSPRALFEGRYIELGRRDSRANYDVTGDGQRFVMIRSAEQQAAPTQLNVVLEWFAEVKRRAPVEGK